MEQKQQMSETAWWDIVLRIARARWGSCAPEYMCQTSGALNKAFKEGLTPGEAMEKARMAL